MELKNTKVHIIGGTGQMGSWLKKFLESQGISPTISDESIKADNQIAEADIIFFSVPIEIAPKVILETAKKVSQNCLLIDLSSIKTETVKALASIKLPSIAIHFLFGPTVSTIQNQKIAYIPIKENKLSKDLINLFKKSGAQIFQMTPKEHDYQMAHIQALTHFVNFSLAKVLIEDKISLNSRVVTPIFLAQLSAISRVISQSPRLVSQIQISNPNFLEVVEKMQKTQSEIIALIKQNKLKEVEEIYENISSNLESLSTPQKTQFITEKKMSILKLKNQFSMAYLGPEGTFSHEVASKIITKKTNLIACKTIYDIFNVVANDRVDFGIVPAENSIDGTIRETSDFLVDFDLKVNLEIALGVHQNLLSKENSLDKISKVISHPQAIVQSREWLKKNLPNATIEYSSSTISAVNEIKTGGVAMIGSILGAKIYKLNILAKNIETKNLNTTKFYIISKNLFSLKKKPTKTLLFLTVFNRVGILKDILTVFADFDINLNKLESRPSKEKNWDYYFYVEVESGVQELRLTQALNILKQFCPRIDILGEY